MLNESATTMRDPATLTPILHCGDPHIEAVQMRILYKMQDYASYAFSSRQSCAINIFFDLSQEFDETSRIHLLPVLVLRMFFQMEAELYTKNDKDELELRTPKVPGLPDEAPHMRPEVWHKDNICYVPVRGKNTVFLPSGQRLVTDENILGILVLNLPPPVENQTLLFLEKFANRVGYSLHNRLLAERNSRHILFVRKLAHDIGHNIITPNLRVKLMLNHLEGQIAAFQLLCNQESNEKTMTDLRVLQQKMAEHAKAISGQFANGALFLETLMRQGHFDLGHYVLRCVRFDLRTLVVVRQFERYRVHLEERGIFIDPAQPVLPDRPCTVQADLGLISQVLANFLSNAAKYCVPVPGKSSGAVRCSVEIIPDQFPYKTPGVKVAVYSTGPHLASEEAEHLFDDNYRAGNVASQYGTGHGLFFVREIVTEHGGRAGYEALEGGNSFYFMLPYDP